MTKIRVAGAAVMVLMAMGTLTACGSGGGNTSTSSKSATPATTNSGTLYIGLDADPPTLDPNLSSALVDRQVMANIYDTLFALTPDGKIVPNLVASYKVSKDGLTYTFQLQKNVKFQDGTPFNAAAVKFNIERELQPSSARRNEVQVIQSVDTPNDNTVVLHLKKPFSPLLGIFTDRAGMMVSPTAVKKEGADYPNHPVGTGPFAFQSRVTGDHITLTANKNYWKGAPKLQTVTFKVFTDPNVELTNLQSGAVQLIDTVPAQQLASLKQTSNFKVSNTPGLGYQGFYLSCTEAPLNNRYLREAIDAAIDRQTLVNVVFKGEASAGWGPFSSTSPVYNAKQATPPKPNDAKVKQLLKEGGKPSGFSFTLQTANSPVSVEVAQIIQSMLKKDNIDMKIEQLEFGTLLSNNTKHAFQASALGWSGRIDPDQNVYNFWYTGGADNGSNFSDKVVDQLLDQARLEPNMAKRTAIYSQFMDEMHQQDPYIFLYFQNNTYAYSSNLQGFQPYPDGVFRLAKLSLS
jgi:peptide/nickel transport system substrate-binding protein